MSPPGQALARPAWPPRYPSSPLDAENSVAVGGGQSRNRGQLTARKPSPLGCGERAAQLYVGVGLSRQLALTYTEALFVMERGQKRPTEGAG